MAHTDNDTVLALAIRDILVANQSALELDGVLYGNHTMIPFSTSAVVVARGKTRTLVGVQGPGGRTDNQLMVGIDVHRAKVPSDEETERKKTDDIATAIEDLINNDTSVGGIIIHGFFDRVDRGETMFINGSVFRSVAMSYSGRTRTLIQ